MFFPVTYQQPQMVSEGLILYLDASDKTSYPGYGNAWRDLSKYNQPAATMTSASPPNFYSNLYGGAIAVSGSYTTTTTHINEIWLNNVYTLNSSQSNWTFQQCFTSNYTGAFDPYWKFLGDSGWFKLEWYNRILAFSTTPGVGFAYWSGYSGMSISPSLERKPNVITFTNNNATMSMYVNGEKNDVVVYTSSSIYYYALLYAQGTGVANVGSIYSHAMYDRALNDAEVRQNFVYQRYRFNL